MVLDNVEDYKNPNTTNLVFVDWKIILAKFLEARNAGKCLIEGDECINSSIFIPCCEGLKCVGGHFDCKFGRNCRCEK